MQLVQPSVALPSPAQIGPLPQHLEQIAEARLRGKKIRRAVTIATLSGWSLAIFAGITLLTGLFDPPTLMLGAGLGLAACIEVRGARDLRRLQVRAPKRLASNQVFLGASVAAYAGYNLWRAMFGPSPLSAGANDPQVSEMLGSFDNLARGISALIYGAIMLVGVLVPGCTALYYASRRRHIEQFIAQSPPWIVELHRRGIGI